MVSSSRQKYYFTQAASVSANYTSSLTINFNGFSAIQNRFAIITGFWMTCYYDLAASVGQLVSCPAIAFVDGLNKGSLGKFIRTAAPGNALTGASTFQFADRIQYYDLEILLGDISTIADPLLNVTLNAMPNVAPAGINNTVFRVVIEIEFWTKKAVKENFDI